ncbi:uncharacterized protein LOC123887090 [Trifolium pratense]|uniref:uncharacterized protein LOC123887090 n=1 Tax=Trifolium pratense TaxID=57577 RepID=UPI001E690A96|nr:uncharacterized protein LOC123887090 [Trifolium pratense]
MISLMTSDIFLPTVISLINDESMKSFSSVLGSQMEGKLKDAKQLRHSGNIKGCIHSMTQVIEIYRKQTNENCIDLNHICEAYCLRALSRQEVEPSSKPSVIPDQGLLYIHFHVYNLKTK